VLENVRTATIKPIIAAKVKGGAQFFTDEYNIYHFTAADYDHRTVNHGAGEYARRDPDGACVHCNTMEGLWSALRNFLDRFKVIETNTGSLLFAPHHLSKYGRGPHL
jgi:hypothetical protein